MIEASLGDVVDDKESARFCYRAGLGQKEKPTISSRFRYSWPYVMDDEIQIGLLLRSSTMAGVPLSTSRIRNHTHEIYKLHS